MKIRNLSFISLVACMSAVSAPLSAADGMLIVAKVNTTALGTQVANLMFDVPGAGAATDTGVYVPGNGVTTPRPVHEVQPSYTAEAMRAKVQGSVLLRCVVKPDGSVSDVEVVRSLDRTFGLDEQAIIAAKQWRFAPGTRLGEAVSVRVSIEMTFTLKNDSAESTSNNTSCSRPASIPPGTWNVMSADAQAAACRVNGVASDPNRHAQSPAPSGGIVGGLAAAPPPSATRDAVIQTLTKDVCTELIKLDLSAKPAQQLQMEVALAIIPVLTKHKAELSSIGVNIVQPGDVQKFMANLGPQLVFECPTVFSSLTKNPAFINELTRASGDATVRTLSGTLVKIAGGEFSYLQVEDPKGKIEKLWWLEYFEGSKPLISDPNSRLNRPITIKYIEKEVFNSTLRDYVTIKIITGIE